jgi:hypothetical protein
MRSARVRFKSVQAACCGVGRLVCDQGERVGLMGFGAHDELPAPRRPLRRTGMRRIGRLMRTMPSRAEPLQVLQNVGRVGASRVLLITDGACSDEGRGDTLQLAPGPAGVLAVVDPLRPRLRRPVDTRWSTTASGSNGSSAASDGSRYCRSCLAPATPACLP